MKKLVNLDDICDSTAGKKETSSTVKSGPRISLMELKQNSHGGAGLQSSSREVMKSHAFNPEAAVSGAVVLYGRTSRHSGYNNYSFDPPPLRKVTGFGVGTVTYDAPMGCVPIGADISTEGYRTTQPRAWH